LWEPTPWAIALLSLWEPTLWAIALLSLWEPTPWAIACHGGMREIAHRGGLLQTATHVIGFFAFVGAHPVGDWFCCGSPPCGRLPAMAVCVKSPTGVGSRK